MGHLAALLSLPQLEDSTTPQPLPITMPTQVAAFIVSCFDNYYTQQVLGREVCEYYSAVLSSQLCACTLFATDIIISFLLLRKLMLLY